MTSRLGTGPGAIALRVAVAIGVLFAAPSLTAWLAGLVLAGRPVDDGALVVRMLAAVASAVLVIGAVALWLRLVERRPLAWAGWRWHRRSPLRLLVGLAIPAAVVAAVAPLMPAGDALAGSLGDPGATGAASLGAVLALALVQMFVLQSLPEELLFRGWLVAVVADRPVRMLAVSSLAFTIPHLLSSGGQQGAVDRLAYLALPFGFGLCAAAMRLRWDDLAGPVGLHGGVHVANAAAALSGVDIARPAYWLTIGGAFALVGLGIAAWSLRRPGGQSPDSSRYSSRVASASEVRTCAAVTAAAASGSRAASAS